MQSILLGPSDEETYEALNDMDCDDVFQKCVQFDLENKFLQIAIDKGFFFGKSNELIMILASCGYIDYVRFALILKADIDYCDGIEGTALTQAANFNKLEIVKYLIENGADPNVTDILECSPIFKSAIQKDSGITKYLIDHGANLNFQDFEGNTPLMHAVLYGRLENVQILLKNGANLKVINQKGNNAFTIAEENLEFNSRRSSYLNRRNIYSLLFSILFTSQCKEHVTCQDIQMDENKYILKIRNDEIHTGPFIINSLIKICKLSLDDAIDVSIR